MSMILLYLWNFPFEGNIPDVYCELFDKHLQINIAFKSQPLS